MSCLHCGRLVPDTNPHFLSLGHLRTSMPHNSLPYRKQHSHRHPVSADCAIARHRARARPSRRPCALSALLCLSRKRRAEPPRASTLDAKLRMRSSTGRAHAERIPYFAIRSFEVEANDSLILRWRLSDFGVPVRASARTRTHTRKCVEGVFDTLARARARERV